MATRRIGVSEARRLLPRLVQEIAREGGRVDITHRGEPRVSLVRSEDLQTPTTSAAAGPVPPTMRVEFNVPVESLIDVVRDLRSRTGQPRRRRARPS
jgi:hypothetical protein